MDRQIKPISGGFIDQDVLRNVGLSLDMVRGGIDYSYHILDMIDKTLIENSAFRLSQMMELANLSTFIGNLFASGIANASNGVLERNGPHKYPDLLSKNDLTPDVEVKIALENNRPKGHLAKPGYYLTCRYVLGSDQGDVNVHRRGDVVWLWEVRFGLLGESDFNKSSTEGDSGKTAVVNREGMRKLAIVYCDLDRMPFPSKSRLAQEYRALYTR